MLLNAVSWLLLRENVFGKDGLGHAVRAAGSVIAKYNDGDDEKSSLIYICLRN